MRWRALVRPFVSALMGGLVLGGATVGMGADHGRECREGACAPHCPVRPAEFGHYQTQWRRWPGGEPRADQPRDTSTPAAPPRSLVPEADEESPRRPVDGGPREGVAPAAAAAVTGRRFERVERLAEEADAARLTDPAGRQAFTLRLVAALLAEPDPLVRAGYVGLAAGFDTPAAEAICAGALEDPDPRVRLAGCRACAERRGVECVARLAKRARDDADLGVRLRAVRLLGELGASSGSGDGAAIPHLVSLLDDPDPAVQSRATAALARITGKNLGTDVARWKEWAAAPDAAPSSGWSLGAAVRSLF